MMRSRWLLVALALTVFSASLSEGSELVGVWSIESFYTEVKTTGEKKNPFGDRPKGYIAFTPEKRLLTVVTASERKKPETDDDRAAAFRSTYAVAGRYRVEGDKYIVRIETAWNEQLVGAEHARTFGIDGDRLTIRSDWAPSAILPGRPEVRGVSVYKRVTAD
jgi:lipocalin-like protein